MGPIAIAKDPVSRKRLLIGMSPGPFSCIAGNIIASYYLGDELDTAGITSSLAQLKANVVLNVVCLFAALGGTHLTAKWGRKPTALLTQCLLVVCLFIIGGLSKVYADNPTGTSQSLIYGDVAVMFLFQGERISRSDQIDPWLIFLAQHSIPSRGPRYYIFTRQCVPAQPTTFLFQANGI